MKKRSLIWHVYPSYLLLSLAAMIAVSVSSVRIIKVFHYERTERELTSAAGLILDHLESLPGSISNADIDGLCKSLGKTSGYRLTVILPSGIVKGDSEEDPARMDNHGQREEVLEALKLGRGTSQRYSATLGEEMMYVALPVPIDGQIGVVRASLSLASIDGAILQVWMQIALAAAMIALFAVAAAYLLAHRIGRPLERIQSAVRMFGQGGSYQRVPSSSIKEVDVLASTLNTMAEQLNDRIATIREQSDELAALLSCMIESVLAVDTDRNVLRMNQAAESMFGVNPGAYAGRSVMEVIRNADLLELVGDTLDSNEAVEKDILLPATNTYLQGHGSVLHGMGGEKIGAVIVLHDITRLRNIERMRRDFVGNVSHELKTPITSILGYVDTLREGAAENVEDRDRFLAIIDKQAGRLKSIVEDLLALSEIEDGVQKGEVELKESAIDVVVQNAVGVCIGAAAKKDIDLEVHCPDEITAEINDALMEQAVVNLIGNAIRYSEPRTKVEVIVERVGREIAIRVRDEGVGVDSKHISRLFERFYRVDKSRSRKLGGTGLGLAIVKHVALAHHGRVDVSSVLGKGSTFSVIIPA